MVELFAAGALGTILGIILIFILGRAILKYILVTFISFMAVMLCMMITCSNDKKSNPIAVMLFIISIIVFIGVICWDIFTIGGSIIDSFDSFFDHLFI